MPPLPAVPNVLRLQVKHTYGLDLDALCTFHLAYTGTAPTSANLNTMCTAVATSWGTNMKPLASANVTLTGITIEDLTTSSSGVGTAAPSIQGTRTGTSLPAQTCFLINFQVSRRYRGGKPRIYMPLGTNTDVSSAQQWSGTFVTAVQTGWAAWLAGIIAAAPSGTTIGGLVNVSYYEGFTVVTNPVTGRSRNINTLRATPLVDTIVATAYSARFATQRRRTTRK